MAMSSTSCCSGLLAKRSAAFAPSPIQQLSLLAQRCNAINLAEGFPDFPAPLEVKEAAIAAIQAEFNQYRAFVRR
jgi:aspartate/methionine/tyrosine aminotransferase